MYSCDLRLITPLPPPHQAAHARARDGDPRHLARPRRGKVGASERAFALVSYRRATPDPGAHLKTYLGIRPSQREAAYRPADPHQRRRGRPFRVTRLRALAALS